MTTVSSFNKHLPMFWKLQKLLWDILPSNNEPYSVKKNGIFFGS